MMKITAISIAIAFCLGPGIVREAAALEGADVALYNDAVAPPGMTGVWQDGLTACEQMLSRLGISWEEIDFNDLNGSPQDFSKLYRIILFPGGYAYWYNYWISLAGKARIRDFVSSGGGYLGICAGAYFPASGVVWDGVPVGPFYNAYGELTGYDLALYPGICTGPINGIAEWGSATAYNMTGFTFRSDSALLYGYSYNIPPRSEEILYYGGPCFSEGDGVSVLAEYDYNRLPAVVALPYGSGRVVLFGPHPEVEEDSERDGITFAMMQRKAEMDDLGSDWGLTAFVLRWLARAGGRCAGGDYDGDGDADLAVFRGGEGLWAVRGLTRVFLGNALDAAVPADYNGDGTTDVAIFRGSTGMWSVKNLSRFYLGISGDVPVPGDYLGNGTAAAGIFREVGGLWVIRNVTRAYFGASGDSVVPGCYNLDDAKDIAIFRGGTGMWSVRNVTRFYFGASTDELVPGDYNGMGKWEGGIFRPATGLWSIRNVTRFNLGSFTDRALPGDYNGDGRDDAGIFRDSSGMWAVRYLTRVYFGASGDIPVTR